MYLIRWITGCLTIRDTYLIIFEICVVWFTSIEPYFIVYIIMELVFVSNFRWSHCGFHKNLSMKKNTAIFYSVSMFTWHMINEGHANVPTIKVLKIKIITNNRKYVPLSPSLFYFESSKYIFIHALSKGTCKRVLSSWTLP